MVTEAAARAMAAVDADSAVDLLRRLVQTPSVTGAEAAVAALLADELRALGLGWVETFDFAPGRSNVVGVATGNGGGGSLLLAGHTDVVDPADWAETWRGTPREEPYGAVLHEGAVWGRGAADMKAGIAAMVAAVAAVRRAGLRPRGDVIVAFVGDEESGVPELGRSAGMRAVVDRIAVGDLPRPDFAVYGEPTRLAVLPAQIGFLIADVTVHGAAAYFGLPWLGVDALKGAHRLLARLFAHADEVWQRASHPLLGRGVLLVTGIEGGGPIAVPERVAFSLIRTVLPSEGVEAARDELEGIVRLFAANEGVRVEIDFPAGRDTPSGGRPVEVDPATPPVEALRRAVAAATGEAAVVAGAPFWSEISFFVHDLGVPAVYFGPGDIAVCHTARERVEVAQVVAAARALAALIVEVCGVG